MIISYEAAEEDNSEGPDTDVIQTKPNSCLKENLYVQGFQDGSFGRGVDTTLAPSRAYARGYRRGFKALQKARDKARKLYNRATKA